MSHHILDIGHDSISLFESKGVYLVTECAKEVENGGWPATGRGRENIQAGSVSHKALPPWHCPSRQETQFFLKRCRGSCESNRLCHGHQVYNQHLTETTVCEKGGCFCGHMTAERQMCELGCATLSPLGTTLSEEAPWKTLRKKLPWGPVTSKLMSLHNLKT